MKKVVCILMILLLSMYGYMAEGIPKKDLYAYGMEALYDFDADSLIAAQAYFEAAGTYKDASLYLLYAQALYYIALSEESLDYLDEAQTNLELLASDEMFFLSLQENGHTSCEDLLKYIEARKLENIGKTEEALEIYVSINRVLDSMQRQRALVVGDKEQRYETALRLFNEGKYNEALHY